MTDDTRRGSPAPLRVAVLGTGGVGGTLGGQLARSGHDVRFLARGPHLARIRERGLELRLPEETVTVRAPASDDAADLGPADLVLVTVKSYSLGAVAPAAAALARDGALVLPLLNGVEAADALVAAGAPAERVLEGVVYVSAFVEEPGVVRRVSPFQRVVLGPGPETDGGSRAPMAEAEAVAAALAGAGSEVTVSDAMDEALWRKLVFLATAAGACALARAPIGPVRDAPLGRRLLERGVSEGCAVARARGVALPAGEEAAALGLLESFPPDTVPSFVRDVDAGGETELDVLSGAIARLGAESGVATPVHDAVVAAVSASLAAGRGA